MKVRIEIDTKTFVRFWLVVIGFGLTGWMVYMARDALVIIGAALFLALALNYPVKKMASFLPGKSRLMATAVAFSSLVIMLGMVIWFVIPPLVQQSAKFADHLPELVDQAGSQWRGLGEFIDKNNLRPQLDAAVENVKNQASGWAANISSSLLSSIGSLVSFLVSLFLVLTISFLMLVEGPIWMSRIWSFYKDKDKMNHHRKLVGRVYGVVTGYINGQLTVSGIGSLAAGLAVFVISLFVPEVEANLAMPVILITFILTLIPMFGATLAGGLVTLLLMLGSMPGGIIYVIFFTIYQQIENNFISPVIQSKKLELSALIVLVAVTIGLYVGGIIGGVIAIPIAGTIKVFLDDYLEAERVAEAEESEKPLKRIIKKIKSKS